MNKPLLISRGIVVFPNSKFIIEIGRQKSLLTINNIDSKIKKQIIIASQINPAIEEPKFNEIYHVGTLCDIVSITNNKDGSIKLTVKGVQRVEILDFDFSEKTGYSCEYELLNETNMNHEKNAEKIRLLYSFFEKTIASLSPNEAKAVKDLLLGNPNPSQVADKIASTLPISSNDKQRILEDLDVSSRIDQILNYTSSDEERAIVDRGINKKINDNLSKQQKEFYLREKLRVVKEELGEISSKEEDAGNLRKRVESQPYPEHIKKRALSEINKIEAAANPNEGSISRTYVEWLLDLPWWQSSKDNNDINKVESVLNKSHYGLEKVKERIIEYLAVRSQAPDSKAPIICLVGPPGVGKSTLVMSIAEALNKKFVKMSLGGVRDEAEIRGHRKTYIGAMPGRIIKAMKKAGVINPLFLLDELDKMSSDMRGDPASAMLEVLDPEQNSKFSDNYIEEDYDLSKVMFVATANYADQIPHALYDRLEIIELTSYTEKEKLEIAKKYLIPKVLKDSGVSNKEVKFLDDAILFIIRGYTREAGVRELQRLIQKIIRKFVVNKQKGLIKTITIDKNQVLAYLKKELFDYTVSDKKAIPGVVNGMAYTTAGGDLLPIEVTFFKGKGNIIITGNLKETMKESASVAFGYVKANAKKYGINEDMFKDIDLHIHVPSGGIPKDGPSAGVTLTTAIISSLKNVSVPTNIAMTGEITLRGRVLIIGGVKEKVISAYRGGVNEIFIPKNDERYLEEVPQDIREKIKFHLVENYDDIYNAIFKNN